MAAMSTLSVLNRGFLHKLQESIEKNLARYRRNESWLEDWAGDEPWELPTSIEVAEPLKLLLPTEKDLFDFENAVRLHKALPTLTPVQAQDPRLWTRLTHVELWNYMRLRWPIERYENKEKAVGRMREQYFVAQRQSRALIRNGAARLWWAARLTYDPDRANAYELTHVLLKSLDIAKNLLERNFGRAPTLTRTFLDFVLRNKHECLASGNSSRLVVRHLTKALNFHGGICVLDCMSPKELNAFLDSEKAKAIERIGAVAVGGGDVEDHRRWSRLDL
ncbi:MAG: hypothetical protein J0M17_08260 [Planctomycetes bacterium]|nr:hypothetical protein [Planctomycetota bacterium]